MMKKHNRTKQKKVTSLVNNRLKGLLISASKAYGNGELVQASQLYQSVLDAQPNNIHALHGCALIAIQNDQLGQAEDYLLRAVAVNKNHIAVNQSLGMVYARTGRYESAIQHYQIVISKQADNAAAHGELARLYTIIGDTGMARKRYRRAFSLNPADPRNIHGLIQLDPASITPDAIARVEQLLNRPDLPIQDRCSFYFALGAINERSARYDEAFANYSVANIARAKRFDSQAHIARIDEIIDVFDAGLFDVHNRVTMVPGADDRSMARPVFIVGMPRSGTTLVEQILASHSDVFAAGELNRIERITDALPLLTESGDDYPRCVEKLSSSAIYHAAQSHNKYLDNLAGGDSLFVTDKMPGNFLYLGLIALMFPQAVILHCQRDPMDVCLSCYFQNFSGDHAYAFDLQNLGLYYQQYQRLMAHWKQVLPVDVLDISYETLVNEPEMQIGRILEFTGLEWQQSCRDFHQTRRAVNTASLVQVRQPMYTSSVSRWRHYEKYLHPLKKNLGLYDITDEVSSIAMIGSLDNNRRNEKVNNIM